MRRTIARLKGLGFILWHARHMAYHVLVGLVWAWFLREQWGAFHARWIWMAVLGSLLPDIDHLFYFFGYGKHDDYTQQITQMLKGREWRLLTIFVSSGHKKNTNLSAHNLYVMGVFVGFSLLAGLIDWNAGVVLFGAILGHYLLDIVDDFVTLGQVNPNWKRWGRPKVKLDRGR